MKTTTNGRWPSNIKSWISQQPVIGSSLNFQPKLRGPNKFKNVCSEEDLQLKTTSKYKKLSLSAATD